jgi:hypothetical protein
MDDHGFYTSVEQRANPNLPGKPLESCCTSILIANRGVLAVLMTVASLMPSG